MLMILQTIVKNPFLNSWSVKIVKCMLARLEGPLRGVIEEINYKLKTVER